MIRIKFLFHGAVYYTEVFCKCQGSQVSDKQLVQSKHLRYILKGTKSHNLQIHTALELSVLFKIIHLVMYKE